VMPTSSSTESFPEPSKTQAPWIKRSTSWGPSWATSDNGPQKRRGKSFIRYRYGAIIGYGLFLSIACGTVVPAAVPDGLNAARGYFDHLGAADGAPFPKGIAHGRQGVPDRLGKIGFHRDNVRLPLVVEFGS